MLIQTNVMEKLEELGVESIGREALSWLGVPIMAGNDPLGVIAVQSYPIPNEIPQTYDSSHQEILITIAAQASAAIQNARLFAQTDEALAQRVQELNSIFLTTHEGILLVDTHLKVLAANRALADFLGVTQTSLAAQNLRLPDPNSPISLIELLGFSPEKLSTTLSALSEDHQEISRETIFIEEEGEHPLERVITPVVDEAKNIKGWLFVFRDLTEEYQLTQLREDLTHMLVHDLRSPIVTIRGGIDMIDSMLHSDDTEDLEEMVQIARRGSDQLLDMINELLDISKLESGEMPLKKNPTNLVEIYQDVYEQISPLAKQSEITVRTNFSPGLPMVNCDSGLIKRTIHNILDNGIKFSSNKSMIKVTAKSDGQRDGHIIFTISDQGPGIPEEYREKIFQKHETGTSSTKGRRIGTGIGLYFCKLAVEAHQGQIWVESEIGLGSIFSFRLPIDT
jgi:PAS domain S-box-containing protein